MVVDLYASDIAFFDNSFGFLQEDIIVDVFKNMPLKTKIIGIMDPPRAGLRKYNNKKKSGKENGKRKEEKKEKEDEGGKIEGRREK